MDDVVNTDQLAHWNSEEARHWVDHDDHYDRLLQPFDPRLLDAAGIAAGSAVLDVGCGCGHTTRAAARPAAPGPVLGVDLSAPMLERARGLTREAGLDNVRFEQADAQVHSFSDGAFDVVVSRFGVMFFADLTAAFANLRRSLRPGGTLSFVCWQSLLDNEWIAVPAGAALEYVPFPESPDPDAPGPFTLADPNRIRSVLSEAGFRGLDLQPLHERLWLGADASDAVDFISRTTVARTIFDPAEPAAVARALDAARLALEPYESAEGVRIGSASWLVHATR